MTDQKIAKVAAVLAANLRTTPESEIYPLAREVVAALAPRVFVNGQDIPPRTVVMSADGSIHGHPEEDQGCYDEGFGAHLGTLVEVMGPDEWSEHASRVGGA